MIKTLLIFVLIFFTSTSIAGDESVQYDASTNTGLINVDSGSVCCQDTDNVELDLALAAKWESLPSYLTTLSTVSVFTAISARTTYQSIRAPPFHKS